MEEISVNVNNSTAAINKRVQNFTDSGGRSGLIINDLIDNIQYFAPLAMKLPVFSSFRNIIAIVKGIRVFMDVLLSKQKV
jgi:hypothetical protein